MRCVHECMRENQSKTYPINVQGKQVNISLPAPGKTFNVGIDTISSNKGVGKHNLFAGVPIFGGWVGSEKVVGAAVISFVTVKEERVEPKVYDQVGEIVLPPDSACNFKAAAVSDADGTKYSQQNTIFCVLRVTLELSISKTLRLAQPGERKGA